MENTTPEMQKVLVKRPRLMRVCKILLIVTITVLYLMQGFIAVPLYGMMKSVDTGELNVKLVFILLAISVLTGITALGFGIAGTVKNENPLTGITVGVKIAMIPFFGLNIVLWILLFAGMLNPFLMFGIPLAAVIGVCLTYVYMLMTGLPDIIYSIGFCIKNKKCPAALLIAGVILSFIFVLDVIGIIMIHRSLKAMISVEE